MTVTTVTTEAPRNDAGQFASTEPAFGREGLERDAGYVPAPDESKTDDEPIKGKEAIREASMVLADSRRSTAGVVTHTMGMAPNVTMTLDQGVTALADSRDADAKQAELDGTKAAKAEVDALRSDGDNYVGHVAAPEPKPAEDAEPDIEKVLKHPKVAAALQERVTETETQRQHYETGLQEIGKARIAAIAADFPELVNLPLEQWSGALVAMNQREPARAQLALTRLNALGEVEAAINQQKQQKTAKEQSEFREYSTRENARFGELTKGIPAKEMAAIQSEVPAMLAEYGVSDPRAFLEAIQNQTTFPRASAERIMIDAAKFRLMQKAARAVPARGAVPNVQRPGIAGAARTNPAQANLQSLNTKLNQATTVNGALKASAEILVARRGNRR